MLVCCVGGFRCPPNAASADWRAIHYPSTPTNKCVIQIQPIAPAQRGRLIVCLLSSPGLLAPVYGATDNGRNVHTLYNLHCVAGDANK